MKKTAIMIILLLALFLSSCTNTPTGKAVAEQEDPIKIGAILPLTGKAAYIGQEWLNGMILAVEEINKKRGINGKSFELIIEDDTTDVKTAVSAMHKLIELDKVNVVFAARSNTASTLAPIAEGKKTVLMATTTTNTPARDHEYVFKDYVDIYGECKKLSEAFKDKKVVLVGLNHDSTLECINALEESSIAFNYEFYDTKDPDFRTITTKIKKQNPDYLIVRPFKSDLRLMVKSLKELDVKTTIACPHFQGIGCDDEEAIREGADMFRNALAVGMFLDKNNPKVNSFIEKYKEEFGKEPGSDSVYYYDTTLAIAETMRICDSKGDLNPECIKHELKNNKFESVTGSLRFDNDGISIRETHLLTYRNGSWQVLE